MSCLYANNFCGKIIEADHTINPNYIYVEHRGKKMEFCSLACLRMLIEQRRVKTDSSPDTNQYDTICDLCSAQIPAGDKLSVAMVKGSTFSNCCARCGAIFKSKDILTEPKSEPAAAAQPQAPKKDENAIETSGLLAFLTKAVEMKGSDLFISTGKKPTLRVNGAFVSLDSDICTKENVDAMVASVLPESKLEEYQSGKDVDLGISLSGVSRFRINIFTGDNGRSMAIRPLPFKIPDIESLHLPSCFAEICHLKSGLILIAGTTGSGKSTTLASILNMINKIGDKHIITIEDPIEFLFSDEYGSLIHQREIGKTIGSFSEGLRSALRENPDVIVVGEMRDMETISLALTAAETGHLVFGTLHSGSAAQTVTRITDAFEAERQSKIYNQLAQSVQVIICQQLLRLKDGSGRIAATEILMATPAVRNIIRSQRPRELNNTMLTGQAENMHLMEQSIRKLVDEGFIEESALTTK